MHDIIYCCSDSYILFGKNHLLYGNAQAGSGSISTDKSFYVIDATGCNLDVYVVAIMHETQTARR